MSVTVAGLFDFLSQHTDSGILDTLAITDVIDFLRIASHIKPELCLFAANGSLVPPCSLPGNVHRFFMSVLDLPDIHVSLLWTSLKELVWSNELNLPLSADNMQRMDLYGKSIERPSHRLGSFMFYPPVNTCTLCRRPLPYSTISRYRVTYFSVQYGSRDAYLTSFACLKCAARFYPNFYVHQDMRCYYTPQVPDVIQIEEHALVSADLCELFTKCMLFAWVSAQNCGNIFNSALSQLSNDIRPHSSLLLSSEQASRAFFYNALLREFAECNQTLVLTDKGDNNSRLKPALEARNRDYIFRGQPDCMHACDMCEKLLVLDGNTSPSSLRAVVTDGITLGRPCCKVHNCEEPLLDNRAHYCETHQALSRQCVVADCDTAVDPGFQTCSNPTHRKLEEYRQAQGKAHFQLVQKLRRIGHQAAYLEDSMSLSKPITDEALPDDLDDTQDPAHKSDLGNKEPKARFGRRRTHNEQLVVACCGIITGRVTMFGAEAISGVKDILKMIYRCSEDLPGVIFYDNNCNLQAHLQTQGDTYFQNVLLPVDVFHFKSKHKESDEFCQRHCNPAQWPELVGQDGKWVFNSSVAEQVNVWMGGYLAIVREMLPYRYDFFLDEMIKWRNEVLTEKLRQQGYVPYRIPYYTHEDHTELVQ